MMPTESAASSVVDLDSIIEARRVKTRKATKSDERPSRIRDFTSGRSSQFQTSKTDCEFDTVPEDYSWAVGRSGKKNLEQIDALESSADSKHHGHGERQPSLVNAIAAALINYLLMFGLCCAYGIIMFNAPHLAKHVGLGVKMNISTAAIVGFILAMFSNIRVAIGGPDLNPVVFIAAIIENLSASIAEELALDYPSRRLGGSSAASDGPVFCAEVPETPDCTEFHETLRATTVFSVAVSTALLGLIFCILGNLRLTSLVSYVPTSVMEAFLSCVGYKVFYYALVFCDYDLKQFVPAACIGVPLYFLKAFHIGNPAVVMPMGLLVPLGIFYIIIYGSGSNLNEARESGFMFPQLPEVEFWETWTGGFLKLDKVSIKAWVATLPDLITMIIVCVLDCLLKMSSTETKLPVKVDKDYEVSLYGLSNIPVVLAGSSVGYMQLKFNVINYGVMGTVKDRRAGMIYAILCATAFFGPIQHFNYLPKAFLSSLLFFAGAGFVAENLWGSRKYLSMLEWMEVLLIVGVFIITKKIIYAVVVGGVLTSIGFIVKYAKIPAIYGPPVRGSMVATRERRQPLQTVCIQHIVSSWAIVVRLKGFLFFASANKLTAYLSRVAEQERNDLPKYRRLKFVVLDCGMLDGMDASSAKAMLRMAKDLLAHDVKIFWTGVRPGLEAEMKTRCVIDDDSGCVMPTTEHAICLVEQKARQYVMQHQANWLSLHPAFVRNHFLIKRRQMYCPFTECVESDSARFACPWNYCCTLKIEKFKTVLWKAGETKDFLFLVHSGAVGLFNNTFDDDAEQWGDPILVYRHSSFLNIEFFLKKAQRYTAVAIESGELIVWGEEQWDGMSRNLSIMTTEIQRTAVAQMIGDAEAVGKELTRTKDDSDGLALVTKKTAKGSGDLPKELSAEVQCIESAAALERLGLYQSVEDRSAADEHPGMPKALLGSLRVAFNTFCVRENGTRVLPVDEVITALLYVGLDGSMLKNVVDHPPLSEGEFLAVAHEAAMARLSVSTKKLIEETFLRYDEDMSGSMDIDELANAFMHALGTEVSVGMIDGIANAYLKNKSSGPKAKDEPPDGLSLEDFTAIVARFCRKHENHVHVLRGIREMTGDDNFFMSGKVSVDMLTGNKYVKISEEEAKEMLFAADWKQSSVHPDRRDDDPIDILRFLGMLTVVLDGVPMPLPPSPVIKGLTKEARQGISVPDEVPCDILDNPLSSEVPSRRMVLPARVPSASPFSEHEDNAKVVDDVPPDTCKAKVYLLLEEPNSSTAASIWSVFMAIIILVSVLTLIAEPLVSPPPDDGETKPEEEVMTWQTLEAVFTVIFSVEYVLRLAVCDALGTTTRKAFALNPLNICDLLAILPTCIDYGMKIISPNLSVDSQETRLLRIVRFLRLSRMARMARLARKSPLAAPVAMVLVVIWGIYMKNGL
mmetsp:Transcript_63589/g.176882  ORF Transcript_63589/g.176882 Transcript_63589/m.176882 type:complete len:1421 (-) Transcript_63589:166-4428(-)